MVCIHFPKIGSLAIVGYVHWCDNWVHDTFLTQTILNAIKETDAKQIRRMFSFFLRCESPRKNEEQKGTIRNEYVDGSPVSKQEWILITSELGKNNLVSLALWALPLQWPWLSSSNELLVI